MCDDNTVKKNVIGLLYSLMWSHIPYGDLAQILRQNVGDVEDDGYSDEFLLQAAKDLYERYIVK